MKYEAIPKLSRSKIEIMLKSQRLEDVSIALMSAAMCCEDTGWAFDQCLTAMLRPTALVRLSAITSMSKFAQLRRNVDMNRLTPVIDCLLKETETSGVAQDLLDDLAAFGFMKNG